jgi:branched-chain amino acid aminotransferase
MQFGSAIFEGIRCYSTPRGPAIFRLKEHLRRLFHSCRVYRMEVGHSREQVLEACRELVRRNELDACYIRPMVLRGYGATSMVPFDSPVEIYLPCWPWGTYLGPEALKHGVDVCVTTWFRVAPNTIPAGAKVAGNYLSGQLVKMEALRLGFDEGISLNTEGRVSEGSGQNLFVISDGQLITSPLDGTLLPGITRDSVIRLARDAGVPVVERAIPREGLYDADEIFLTGTATEVTPVRSVDRITIGAGKVGPITRELQHTFLGIARGEQEDRHGWLTHVRD